MVISEEEKRITAYHEAGHALVRRRCSRLDPLHKVTIIPRGMALGVTMQLPIDDKNSYTQGLSGDATRLPDRRPIAEEIFLNQMTTGAGNDIERATELARKMVCEWGMSDLGPLSFGKKEEQIFLGREITQHRDYSGNGDQDRLGMRRFVDEGYNRAKAVLTDGRETLIVSLRRCWSGSMLGFRGHEDHRERKKAASVQGVRDHRRRRRSRTCRRC